MLSGSYCCTVFSCRYRRFSGSHFQRWLVQKFTSLAPVLCSLSVFVSAVWCLCTMFMLNSGFYCSWHDTCSSCWQLDTSHLQYDELQSQRAEVNSSDDTLTFLYCIVLNFTVPGLQLLAVVLWRDHWKWLKSLTADTNYVTAYDFTVLLSADVQMLCYSRGCLI